jgi:hypothetical protein
MRKTYAQADRLVDRLEKKYQKKLRTQKYRSVKQVLSGFSGRSTDDFDATSPELQALGGYEYLIKEG